MIYFANGRFSHPVYSLRHSVLHSSDCLVIRLLHTVFRMVGVSVDEPIRPSLPQFYDFRQPRILEHRLVFSS